MRLRALDHVVLPPHEKHSRNKENIRTKGYSEKQHPHSMVPTVFSSSWSNAASPASFETCNRACWELMCFLLWSSSCSACDLASWILVRIHCFSFSSSGSDLATCLPFVLLREAEANRRYGGWPLFNSDSRARYAGTYNIPSFENVCRM